MMKMHAISFVFFFGIATAAWVKEMENPQLFQGDMVLDPDEKENKNGNLFASIKGGRWPGAKVPYVITSSIGSSGRRVIQQAFEQYHKFTCLRFVPRGGERSYISFHAGSGCSSPVGYRNGRRNDISLGRGCQYLGTTMHEIGHSIGLYHEQSRPDRDSYVRILWNNIQKSMRFNFDKFTTQRINSLGTPYDFKSMMHYGATAFGGRSQTIQTINPANQRLIGQRNGFSETDIKQINLMYCGGKVTPTGAGGTVAPGGCSNTDTRCNFWASNGYCAASNAVESHYRDIMKNKCCQACRDSAQCRDRNDRCAEWANRGECKKNPKYMEEFCRKACRRCS